MDFVVLIAAVGLEPLVGLFVDVLAGAVAALVALLAKHVWRWAKHDDAEDDADDG